MSRCSCPRRRPRPGGARLPSQRRRSRRRWGRSTTCTGFERNSVFQRRQFHAVLTRYEHADPARQSRRRLAIGHDAGRRGTRCCRCAWPQSIRAARPAPAPARDTRPGAPWLLRRSETALGPRSRDVRARGGRRARREHRPAGRACRIRGSPSAYFALGRTVARPRMSKVGRSLSRARRHLIDRNRARQASRRPIIDMQRPPSRSVSGPAEDALRLSGQGPPAATRAQDAAMLSTLL